MSYHVTLQGWGRGEIILARFKLSNFAFRNSSRKRGLENFERETLGGGRGERGGGDKWETYGTAVTRNPTCI